MGKQVGLGVASPPMLGFKNKNMHNKVYIAKQSFHVPLFLPTLIAAPRTTSVLSWNKERLFTKVNGTTIQTNRQVIRWTVSKTDGQKQR